MPNYTSKAAMELDEKIAREVGVPFNRDEYQRNEIIELTRHHFREIESTLEKIEVHIQDHKEHRAYAFSVLRILRRIELAVFLLVFSVAGPKLLSLL